MLWSKSSESRPCLATPSFGRIEKVSPVAPEQSEAYAFTTYDMSLTDVVARCRLLATHMPLGRACR